MVSLTLIHLPRPLRIQKEISTVHSFIQMKVSNSLDLGTELLEMDVLSFNFLYSTDCSTVQEREANYTCACITEAATAEWQWTSVLSKRETQNIERLRTAIHFGILCIILKVVVLNKTDMY